MVAAAVAILDPNLETTGAALADCCVCCGAIYVTVVRLLWGRPSCTAVVDDGDWWQRWVAQCPTGILCLNGLMHRMVS